MSFLKRFTRLQDKAVSPNPEPSAPDTSAALEPCVAHKVLIVDDEKTVRVALGRIIEFGLPYCVIEFAAYGEAAVAAFSQSHPKIVIMDLKLPSISGVQAFHDIMDLCAEKRWQPPCVIFCTGYSPGDEVKNIVKGHPDHQLIMKPVKPETLIDAVKKRLD